jgi:hypothetical protein
MEGFTENQKVWLDTRNFATIYNKKIRSKREGPFKVKKVLGPVTYQLQLPKTWNIHNIFHAIHLSPYNETTQYRPNELHPPPDLVDNEEEYKVHFKDNT